MLLIQMACGIEARERVQINVPIACPAKVHCGRHQCVPQPVPVQFFIDDKPTQLRAAGGLTAAVDDDRSMHTPAIDYKPYAVMRGVLSIEKRADIAKPSGFEYRAKTMISGVVASLQRATRCEPAGYVSRHDARPAAGRI